MYLAAQRLRDGGEMVAIVPRSFCNGPYFKRFRKQFFSMMVLRHIHIFTKRNTAFTSDDIVQEHVILHAVKGGRRGTVAITTSRGGDFALVEERSACVTPDFTLHAVEYESVIRSGDPELFVHIATSDTELRIVDLMARFTATLSDIGVQVSTGPVVDFRLKGDLRNTRRRDLYHFSTRHTFATVHFGGRETQKSRTRFGCRMTVVNGFGQMKVPMS